MKKYIWFLVIIIVAIIISFIEFSSYKVRKAQRHNTEQTTVQETVSKPEAETDTADPSQPDREPDYDIIR